MGEATWRQDHEREAFLGWYQREIEKAERIANLFVGGQEADERPRVSEPHGGDAARGLDDSLGRNVPRIERLEVG